jgi:outer membrane protein assembly factor BamB
MKTKYLILIGLLLALIVILSGCAGGLTASGWPGITTDAKNAYIAGGSYVYAVNLETGVQAWRFPEKATANPFDAAPVLTSDGQLIVGGYDKKLYSLNPQTGQQTGQSWPFTGGKDRWIGAVLATDKMIYAPNADYNLYALNLQGQLQWTFAADQSIWGAPVTDGTNVFFGTLGRKVYAVNAQTGKQTWVQKVDGAVLGSPVLGPDATLFVGSYGGTIYALSTSNGQTRWSKATSSWIWSGPTLDGGNLYVGDGNGKLWAFSASNGSILWEKDFTGAIFGSPLVIGEKLVVGTVVGKDMDVRKSKTTGFVYFLDTTGKNPQQLPLTGILQFIASPAGDKNLVLIAPTGQPTDPILLALDSTGAVKWPFTPAK